MAHPPLYSCPVCKRQQTEEALPVTRTTARGRRIVVALRRRCLSCGYTDRTTMFRGAASLNYEEPRDACGRQVVGPAEED